MTNSELKQSIDNWFNAFPSTDALNRMVYMFYEADPDGIQGWINCLQCNAKVLYQEEIIDLSGGSIDELFFQKLKPKLRNHVGTHV